MSWHIEGCTGACLACLIEEIVRKHYGKQGLEFLLRKVDTATVAGCETPTVTGSHITCGKHVPEKEK
jgi:hypothetical protein